MGDPTIKKPAPTGSPGAATPADTSSPAPAPESPAPALPQPVADGSGGWLPPVDAAPTRPTNPGEPDLYRTARWGRLTKEASTLVNQSKNFYGVIEAGLAKDALSEATQQSLNELKLLNPDRVAELMAAAKNIAARHATGFVMTGFARGEKLLSMETVRKSGSSALEMLKGQAQWSSAERAVEMEEIAHDGMEHGVNVASAYLKRKMPAELATKAAAAIDGAKTADKALANVLKAGNFAKWLGRAAHGVAGLLTLYDAYKSFQTFQNPKATTTEKVAGVVTVVADAFMFVPFPPLQLVAAAVSVAAPLFRDSEHPWQDAKKFMGTKWDQGMTFLGIGPTQPAGAH
jgi:hypothetical protein